MVKSCFLALIIFLLAGFLNTALAVTLNISNYPSTISTDSFTVDVQVTGANVGTNYLRVDLYKDGTTQYFGETFNGSSWYNGSDGLQYFPITIGADETGTATVQARVGSPSSSEYDGPGTYKLKIRRYTSSGSATNDTQTPVNVQITVAGPSPSPSSTPTPSPSPSPSPSKSPSPTPKPSVKPSPKVSPSPEVLGDDENKDEKLDDERQELYTTEPSPEGDVKDKKSLPLVAGIFIVGGIGFMGAAAYPFIKRKWQK